MCMCPPQTGLYGAAAECLQQGVALCSPLVGSKSNIATGSAAAAGVRTAWKLLGDLHAYAHRLPPGCFGGHVTHGEFVQGAIAAYEQVSQPCRYL